MSKHTPGPWHYCGCGKCQLVWGLKPADGSDPVLVHDMPCDDEVPTAQGKEGVANARLIAAAPELANVAHMVLTTATVYTPPELVKAATEALRKAGEL